MEALQKLLESEAGIIFGACLLFIGLTDSVITFLFFGSRIRRLGMNRAVCATPEQKAEIDKQLRGLQIASYIVYATGLFFIIGGLYSLSLHL